MTNTQPPKLSPEAIAAMPEIVAFLRDAADRQQGEQWVTDGLRVAANILNLEAGKSRGDS